MDEVEISEDELTRLALAADPDEPIPDGAVPIDEFLGVDRSAALLPDWLMPAPAGLASTRTRRRVATVGLVIVGLLAVNAVGLCVTNGYLEIAW